MQSENLRVSAASLFAAVMIAGTVGCGADTLQDSTEFDDTTETHSQSIVWRPPPPPRLHATTPRAVSSWSGRSGATKIKLEVDPDEDAYVWGFKMYERYDDPCKFDVFMSDLEDSDHYNSLDQRFEDCGYWGPNISSGSFKRMDEDYRTTGLAVCLNSARNKMKGFAIVGRYERCIRNQAATAHGESCASGGPLYVDAVAERNNCPGSRRGIDSDWERIRECPLGMVMTGIEINVRNGGGNRRMVNGARAICHDLVRN